MITVKDLIKQLQQYDENLEVGVYVDTTSYGSYYLYEDGCTMLCDYTEDCIGDGVPIKPSQVYVLPCGVSMD